MDNYVIVYLHSGAPQHSMPPVSLLHKFYRIVDRRCVLCSQPCGILPNSALCRLRKQLQHLYIVHPTFWVRSMLRLARPFVRLALFQPHNTYVYIIMYFFPNSSKFYRKVHVVPSLQQLSKHVPLERHLIPASVLQYDSTNQLRSSSPAPALRYTPTPAS